MPDIDGVVVSHIVRPAHERNAVHLRLHTFGSPLPFRGEGLGERVEGTAKLPVSPSPRRGEGTDRAPLFLK